MATHLGGVAPPLQETEPAPFLGVPGDLTQYAQ